MIGRVPDQGAVGFARFRDHGAVGRPGGEAAVGALAGQRRAAEHRRRHPALAEQPRHHPGDRALAAGPGDGHPGLPPVDHFGEQRRPGHQLEAQAGGRPQLRCVRLHGRGVDEPVDGLGHGLAVVGVELDAQGAKAVGQVAVLAGVERPVGALDLVTALPHQAGQGVHAGAGDAREVVARGGGHRGIQTEHAAGFCTGNARAGLANVHSGSASLGVSHAIDERFSVSVSLHTVRRMTGRHAGMRGWCGV